ncbi:MAG: CHAT domain-containing protein, partial [Waterburya sp.]
PLSLVKAKALFSLADVLRVTGNLPQSKAIIEQTLQFKKAISLPIKSKALLSLAKTEEALGRRYPVDSAAANKNLENALIHYQQAINKSNAPLVNAQVLLEQFNLLIDRDRSTAAANLLPAIDHYLGQSRLNSQSIYTQVNLAKSLIFLQQQQSKYPQSNNQLLPEANQLLTNAIALAQQIEDTRAESYAAGNLGRLYEYQQQNNQAQQYSNRALKLAQAVQAKELAYQWDWQLARLFKETDILAAKTYYHQAYNILNDLRTDLVALNPEIRFSFRENIEPIYREYVDLLLLAPQPSQTNLKQARDVLEALQLAELDNFFRDACVNVKPEAVDQVVENAEKPTAVIYGIILKDRLEIILKLPGKENITSYRTKISQEDVAKNLNQLIERLRDRTRYSYQVQEYSQKVYEWIIRPVEEKLQSNNIENLVFVLDGLLRNIPMAVLYDQNEQKYLIEKYPIALAPGLQLLSPKPFKDIEPSQLNVLTAGLSEERLFEKEQRQFNRLDYVKQELEKIQLEVPASYELLDKNFDNQKLQAQLATNKYNVAHFATHGEFNSDPDKTFIVLSDKLLKVRDLDNLLRVEKGNQSIPIELLVLSACQTAVGDNRATLGLAGVAVRAGARSTIATLWSVGDESTAELMSKFYHQLINTDGINKAEALQKAQIEFLHDEKLHNKYWDRPYYWSSLVLLGNWL